MSLLQTCITCDAGRIEIGLIPVVALLVVSFTYLLLLAIEQETRAHTCELYACISNTT